MLPADAADGYSQIENVSGPVLDEDMDLHPHLQHPHEEVVRWLEHLEARQRGMDASRLRLIAAAVDQLADMPASVEMPGSAAAREIAHRSLRAELALALNLSERRVETQMNLATELVHAYPTALDALESGIVSLAHARVVVDAGSVIGAGDAPETVRRRREYEAAVLEIAARETPNRLRAAARRLAEQWAERSIDERQQQAEVRRRVLVVDREDGMADLIAHLPALEAYAIHDRLTRIARAAERGERAVPARRAVRISPAGASSARSFAGGTADDTAATRTRDQLRADVCAELLLAADEHSLLAGSTVEAIRGRVEVSMRPAGADEAAGAEPSGRTGQTGPPDSAESLTCELTGYGPIGSAAAMATAAAERSWDRIVADEQTGEVLRVDRYRPSEEMRRMLGARDQHCRFPGCRMPVHRCDLDHTLDAARGGPTSIDNLAHLCRGHHMLKHHSSWRVSQDSAGALRWRSPTGRQYVDRPSGVRTPRTRTPGTRTVGFVPF